MRKARRYATACYLICLTCNPAAVSTSQKNLWTCAHSSFARYHLHLLPVSHIYRLDLGYTDTEVLANDWMCAIAALQCLCCAVYSVQYRRTSSGPYPIHWKCRGRRGGDPRNRTTSCGRHSVHGPTRPRLQCFQACCVGAHSQEVKQHMCVASGECHCCSSSQGPAGAMGFQTDTFCHISCLGTRL